MHSSAYVRNIHSEHSCTFNEPSPNITLLNQKPPRIRTSRKKFKQILQGVENNKSSSSTEDVGLQFGHYKLYQYHEINISF